ncbi:MAG: phosphonopyruvate decarboxylase [Pseudomonadota bacterium]
MSFELLPGVLKAAGATLVAYVPDAGHAGLIRAAHEDPALTPVSLTTEEEGVAFCAGAWAGGARAVLLMQSSGVGNCLNMLSLIRTGRYPFLTLVTMRGEWGEFNPWQVPMSRATAPAFELMEVGVQRVDAAEDLAPTVEAAARMAWEGGAAQAVLIGQRVIGSKSFLAAPAAEGAE